MSLYRRFRNLFRRERLNDDVERELAFHIAEAIDDARAQGLSDDEAARQARQRFGAVMRYREEVREADLFHWLELAGKDLRYALRTLSQSPSFTLPAVVLLALGIGGTSTMFSLVDTVLWKPLPYPDSGRLMRVYERDLRGHGSEAMIAPGRLEDWDRASSTFQSISGTYAESLSDTSVNPPERLAGSRIAPRFFEIMRTPPAYGRIPNEIEEREGGPEVVVLSDRFWRRRFEGDPSAVGRRLILGGRASTVIGIMPPSFAYPSTATDIWLPAHINSFLMRIRRARFFHGVGRLKPGVTAEEASAELNVIQQRLGRQYPDTDKDWSAIVRPLKEEKVGSIGRSLWLLLGAVGVLLAIACGNVACLLLERMERRTREMAVRFALGASQGAVVRQLLLEGLALSFGGAVLGLTLADAGLRLLKQFATAVPRIEEVKLDLRMVLFTAGLCFVTTLVCSLVPAMESLRRRAGNPLRFAGRSVVSGGGRVPRLLVMAQVALTFLLLAGAGLLLRSLDRLMQVSPGFDASSVLAFRVTAEWGEDRTKVGQMQVRILAGLGEIPGVASTGLTSFLPTAGTRIPDTVQLLNRPSRTETAHTQTRYVTAGYFSALRIPLLAGAPCDRLEALADRPPTAVVNRSFVDEFLDPATALGATFSLSGSTAIRVAGIAADARELGLSEEPVPTVYMCMAPGGWPDPYYLVRTNSFAASSIVAAVRSKTQTVDPNRAVYGVQPLEAAVAASLRGPQLNSGLLVFFGLAALLMAAAGIYGTLSYAVAGRTREIGLRTALGASRTWIISMVFRQGAQIVVPGIVIGVGTALAAGRVLGALLYEVKPNDGPTLVAVAVVLASVASFACAIPALRASRIDPMEALRTE